MKVFGREHHGTDTPWVNAPPWAIELSIMLGLTLANTEYIMAAIDDLNTAVADLKAEVAAIGADMDTLFADLQAAHASGNDAAVAAATADIRSSIDALKAAGARDMPAVPVA